MDFNKMQAYQQTLLNQVYLQEIERNESRLKTWIEYKDRHIKVIQGLEKLVLQLSVNCMVPIGKRALMKGKLMHTNEILVCIGDGYFVKYSAQQATALCNRRIKTSEEMIKKLEEEKNLLQGRQTLPFNCGAFESEDCKDIVEFWDEQNLQDWRTEHKSREKEYRQKLNKLKNLSNENLENEITQDDLFKRLDELELEEELADELNGLEDSGAIAEQLLKEDQKEKNENVDKNCEISDVDEEDDNEEDDNDDDEEDDDGDDGDVGDDGVDGDADSNCSNTNTTCNRDQVRKISGKFEVSIIKEDDVGKAIAETELHSNDHEYKKEQVKKTEKPGRRVSFADPQFVEIESAACGDELKNSEIDGSDLIKIEFRHSQTKALDLESTNSSEINNPSDIYTIFSKPKSILKISSGVNYVYVNKPLIEEDTLQEECAEENDNLTRSTYITVVQDVKEKSIDSPMTRSVGKTNENRPMSKFRLERAHQNNELT